MTLVLDQVCFYFLFSLDLYLFCSFFLFTFLSIAGRGPPRELIMSAQAPLILENRLVCKFEFKMEFSVQGMEDDEMGKGKERSHHSNLATIRGVVEKGKNFEVFSIPLVEINKRAPRAKLFVKLKGYRWSDPVEVVMPTMDEKVSFLFVCLFVCLFSLV